MSFALPHFLWLLALVPPGLVVFFWWAGRNRERLMTKFIGSRLLPALVAGRSPARQRIRHILLVSASVCVILALARPQWGFSWQEVKQQGVDIVVAIDCSKSMLAADIAPNRLARAKLAALELMQKARNDRLGLVAFAGSAFLVCPLTIDDVAFAQSVDSLDVNTISLGGTAIAEAIETALTAFKEGDNHKVLVLMTDGEDHDAGAVEAAQKAAQAGLRIYTIGIGTPEGDLVRIKDSQGRMDYVRDEQGNVVKSRLDEHLLAEIATATKGGAYLMRGARTIDTLYEQHLASLPKSEHDQKLVKQYHQRFHWPLAAAILLLLAEILLPERKRLSGPSGRLRSVGAAGVSLLALLVFVTAAQGASPAAALREYKAGKYDQAQKDYEQLLKRKSDDPRLHFNAGAAAYRNGQYADAAKQFDSAASSPDLKLQESAFYNRGNSLFRLGEKAPDQRQRMENWEKALKDFEMTSKLNTNDVDAKFNYDFVKKRLEELKQQQQQQQQGDQNQKNSDQQQQQNQNQSDNQSKQDKEQQQPQSSKDQSQSQSQQQPQNQPGQTQDQQQQQQQQPNERTDQQQAQKQAGQGEPQPKPDTQRQEQTAQASGDKDSKEEEEKSAAAAGQMTPEQARQLMDAQRGREKMLSSRQQKPADRSKRIKDW